MLVRGEHVRQERVGAFSAAVDIVWISVITLFTERGASPFFMLHVFLISSVSVRWGLAPTVRLTVFLALAYPAMMWVACRIYEDDFMVGRPQLVRPVYLLVIGYLIGYLGEHERRSKRKLGLLLDLTSLVHRTPPTGRTLTQLMRRALGFFEAQQALLVLRDPTAAATSWSVTRRAKHIRVGLRITAIRTSFRSQARRKASSRTTSGPGAGAPSATTS